MEATVRPGWVYKRDGRLVPFERDKISQALFAAGEALGKTDAFLARELADGVLHFLDQECASSDIPTTAQIADLIVKVVRELGHPDLAQAFARQNEQRRLNPLAPVSPAPTGRAADTISFQFSPLETPETVVRDCLRTYSLHAIFSRDLAAAVAEGWLTVTGLDAPLTLAGGVVDPRTASKSSLFGRFVAVDGPEYASSASADSEETPSLLDAPQGLLGGLRPTGVTVIMNLNGAAPPAWAAEHGVGPLFGERRGSSPPAAEPPLLHDILDGRLDGAGAGAPLRTNWHLGERDFGGGSARRERLMRIARLALEVPGVELVFDRPRRPPVLAEGVDRRQPAVLLEVAVHLPRILTLPGVSGNAERFLLKLASLAHMAVSAGVQKRNFLRRQASATFREFMLDRARLVVAPVGLEAVVRALTGKTMCAAAASLDLGRQIIASLDANLRSDGRGANLDTCVDAACWLPGASAPFTLEEKMDTPVVLERVAGVTAWDPAAPPKAQLHSAGLLHAAAGGWGTAAVLMSPERPTPIEEVIALLDYAWKQTEVVRLRFVRLPVDGPARVGGLAMTGPENPIPKHVRTMQVIAGTLIGGVLMFAGLTLYLVFGQDQAQGQPPEFPIISLVALAWLVVGMPLAYLVPRIVTRNALRRMASTASPPDDQDTVNLLALRQTTMIIGMALLEGTAFMGILAFLVEAEPLVLAIPGTAILAMLAYFPTHPRVQGWLDLQWQRLRELRDEQRLSQ